MKGIVFTSLIAVVGFATLATWVRAQSGPERPPGVDEASWIALSDNAGIVLTELTSMPAGATFRFENNEPVLTPQVQRGTGVLVAKVNGIWTRVDFEPPGARMLPLHDK